MLKNIEFKLLILIQYLITYNIVKYIKNLILTKKLFLNIKK
jgi:hypothetical protein